MKLAILKCHGSGNDFVLIDETTAGNSGIPDRYRMELVRTVCDRTTGIGADGVLFYQASETADCRMRMFNPDGGEAEMCGNGLRCIGRYCAEKLSENTVSVETMKATLSAERAEPVFEGVETFEVEIGPISLAPDSLPMVTDSDRFVNERVPDLPGNFTFTALSVPNPHIVSIVDEVAEESAARCGVAANNSAAFPRGVNVSFLRCLGDNDVYVVTYERGVGITYSCGTGMSASAYVSALLSVTDYREPISVFNKGGMVKCIVPEPRNNQNERIKLKGNATFVFESTIDLSDDFRAIKHRDEPRVRHDEIAAYEKAQEYAASIVLERTIHHEAHEDREGNR